MRIILVFLITSFLLWPAIEAGAGDLFLVRIVSTDKENKQVVAAIVDGPDRLEAQADASAPAGLPEVTIAGETLVVNTKPGDLLRVWGVVSANGKELILDTDSPTGGGSDLTGVRRRLKNKIRTQGQGNQGRGHGKF